MSIASIAQEWNKLFYVPFVVILNSMADPTVHLDLNSCNQALRPSKRKRCHRPCPAPEWRTSNWNEVLCFYFSSLDQIFKSATPNAEQDRDTEMSNVSIFEVNEREKHKT